MSEFKSQAEVWQSLLDGNIVLDKSKECKYKFEDGNCIVSLLSTNNWLNSDQSFYRYKNYEIYIEQKPKKIVRMAPALSKLGNGYFIADAIFQSEEIAKERTANFIKWLIDTHGVDVEVDE